MRGGDGSRPVKLGGGTGKIFELEPAPQRSSSAHEKRSPTDVVQEGDDQSKQGVSGHATAQRRQSGRDDDFLMPPDMSTEEHKISSKSDAVDAPINDSRSGKDSRNPPSGQSATGGSKDDSDGFKGLRPGAITTSQAELMVKSSAMKDEKLAEGAGDADDEADDDDDESGGSPSPDMRGGNRAHLEPNTAPGFGMIDKFRSAVAQDQILSAEPRRVVPMNYGPPPEDLIKKTAVDDEPVKTGAAFAFIKFNRLMGRERIEKLNPDNDRTKNGAENGQGGNPQAAHTGTDISSSTTITDYMLNAKEAGRLVYCRFGEKYMQDMERRKHSNLTAINQPTSNLSSATYLINIKKLVDEHNIDGEKRDFQKMRGGQMSKGFQLPPQQFYKLTGPEDRTLIFESRFESGNLLAAIKVSDAEYDLILQNDINTNGHTQWYFFRVGNTFRGQRVKFNIVNLAKPDSLYNYGMKILCFSNKIKETEGVGWHRVGENINYHSGAYKRDNNKFLRTFYTFTFTHTFEHDQDQLFFSHCFPYTYSDLQEDVGRIEKDTATANFFHRSTLCRTLAGNRCDMLTITSKDKDPKSAKALAKKGVFISARVHPGESNASWMMKGVIDFLVQNTPEARALRDHFIFKIVPILNPDGVINGNYRCSLSGQDLNRRWKAPSRVLHPVNFAVKKLIRSFAKDRELVLYCDLHGHSRRKNIFMYGNNLKEQPHATRVFPYILSKLCDFFSFEQSRFSMSRLKDGTARIAMFKELNISNIFTMEASFCGADRGDLKDQHFTTDALMLAGRRLLEALIVYAKIEVTQNVKEIRKGKDEKPVEEKGPKDNAYKQLSALALEKELSTNKKLISMTMGDEGNSSGSDSEPSADNLEEEEMAKIVPIKDAKKKIEKKPVPPPPAKKPVVPVKQKPQSPSAARRLGKEPSKSPTKRPTQGYYLFDRLAIKKRKPEMRDAATQTTPKSKEQMEKERREQRQRKNAAYLLQQQQFQQQMMQKHAAQQQHLQGQLMNYRPGASQPQINNANNLSADQKGLLGKAGATMAPSTAPGAQSLLQGGDRQFFGQRGAPPQMVNFHHSRQMQGAAGNVPGSAFSQGANGAGPGQNLTNMTNHFKAPQKGPLAQSGHTIGGLVVDKNKAAAEVAQDPDPSPKPQIRIRTEHHPANGPFKPKPSTDLAKFEEGLTHGQLASQKAGQQLAGPTQLYHAPNNQPGQSSLSGSNNSQQLKHLGSGQRLPQIPNSSSQRKRPGASQFVDGGGQLSNTGPRIHGNPAASGALTDKQGGTQQLYHQKQKLLSQTQYNSLTLHGAPGHPGPATPGFKPADVAAGQHNKLINYGGAEAAEPPIRQTSGQQSAHGRGGTATHPASQTLQQQANAAGSQLNQSYQSQPNAPHGQGGTVMNMSNSSGQYGRRLIHAVQNSRANDDRHLSDTEAANRLSHGARRHGQVSQPQVGGGLGGAHTTDSIRGGQQRIPHMQASSVSPNKLNRLPLGQGGVGPSAVLSQQHKAPGVSSSLQGGDVLSSQFTSVNLQEGGNTPSTNTNAADLVKAGGGGFSQALTHMRNGPAGGGAGSANTSIGGYHQRKQSINNNLTGNYPIERFNNLSGAVSSQSAVGPGVPTVGLNQNLGAQHSQLQVPGHHSISAFDQKGAPVRASGARPLPSDTHVPQAALGRTGGNLSQQHSAMLAGPAGHGNRGIPAQQSTGATYASQRHVTHISAQPGSQLHATSAIKQSATLVKSSSKALALGDGGAATAELLSQSAKRQLAVTAKPSSQSATLKPGAHNSSFSQQ